MICQLLIILGACFISIEGQESLNLSYSPLEKALKVSTVPPLPYGLQLPISYLTIPAKIPPITKPLSPVCLSIDSINRCNGNPCDVKCCPAYPKAVCRPNYCNGGCKAQFFLNGIHITNCNIQNPSCPPGVRIVNCFVDPCTISSCRTYPNAVCKSNYCGGCNAEWYNEGKIIDCNKATTVCPPNQPPVNCLVAPCLNAKCSAHPEAECRDDYCGGCFARFYLGQNEVNCSKAEPKCPPNVPVVNCLINPCAISQCPRYPSAICVANYCGGCSADYYVKGKIVDCGKLFQKRSIAKPSPCPPSIPLVNCLVDPCKVNKCPAHPDALCISNYCGGCNADFYLGKEKVDCTALPGPKPAPCPNGVPIVNCLIDPCSVAKCPEHPNAICISNYCGGCNADFYEGKNKVECSPKPTKDPGSTACPFGIPIVNCLIDPCSVAKCPEHPNAICKSNYCGGCNADFYVGKLKVICEQTTPASAQITLCPLGVPVFNCFVDPCTFATCPTYPKAICNSNYCRGCNADFFIGSLKVDCNSPTTTSGGTGCPPDKPLALCKVDPCVVTKCPCHPKAECKANYCGGCFAEFYIKGKRVKCEISYKRGCNHGTKEQRAKCRCKRQCRRKCKRYPRAHCVASYKLGKCDVVYYNEKKIVEC